jgi:ketosteroid isomerase-like protein
VGAEQNAAIARDIFDCFARGDALRLRGLFHVDAEWTVPGESSVAGTYRGRTEILRFLASLRRRTGGTYRSRLIDALGSEDRAAVLYRATGTRNGIELDIDQVLLFTIRGDAVSEVVALPGDPLAFERFWSEASDSDAR